MSVSGPFILGLKCIRGFVSIMRSINPIIIIVIVQRYCMLNLSEALLKTF